MQQMTMTTSLWSSDGARHVLSANMTHVKVLVVGETAVGKTALVQSMCGEWSTGYGSGQQWTVGASVDVLLHSAHAGTPQERHYFVELFDIGSLHLLNCQ